MGKESSPLLVHSIHKSYLPGIHDTKNVSRREMIKDELFRLLYLAIPVIFTYFMEFLPGIVNIILVGHIDSPETDDYLGGASLAVMYVNLTGLSIGFGLATAMDTLCSQAFGAKRTKLMGVYLQTGILVLGIAFIGVFFANYYCTRILLLLKQPPRVAELAGDFAKCMLPGIPFLYLYELLKKILQAQNIANPMLVVAILSNIVNVAVGYQLVYYSDYGYLGAAIARTVSNISFPLLLMPYLYFSGITSSFWNGVDLKKAWKGVGEFVSLGVSGMLMMCFEWWAFELIALLSGWLPNAVEDIAANAILLNISASTFMLYLGFSVAGNVRIGNALGAGQPDRAKVASFLSIGLSFISAFVMAFLLLQFRHQIPLIFTSDPHITDLTSSLIVVAAVFQLADAINAGIQGSFRGCGKQALGAKLNFIAYYVVGIPCGAVLAFLGQYDLTGLWVGMTCGLFAISIMGSVMLCFTNWVQLAIEAQQRATSHSF